MAARAKRRLTWVAAAGGIAVIGAAFHFLDSDGASGPRGSDAASAQRRALDQSVGVSYGDSSRQVLARVGSPTGKQGTCWIYRATANTVHGAYLGKFEDGVRYCFGDGPAGGRAVTAIEVHVVPHTKLDGTWYPGGWLGGSLHHVFDSTGSGRSTTTTPRRQEVVGEQNGGIAYGDTQRAVSTTLGDPTAKQAGCWIYTLRGHAVNGMNLGKIIDAIKYCFTAGPAGGRVVSTIYVHLIPSVVARLPKDKRPPGGWTHPFTFMPKASQVLKS